MFRWLAALAALLSVARPALAQAAARAGAISGTIPAGMPAARYGSADAMEAAAFDVWRRGQPGVARAMIATAQAYRQLGRPYLFGGTGRRDPRIDCSALVQWAYARAGLTLPRTSREQARVGFARPRAIAALAVGDLLFFGTRDQISHVGLYLGGGYFVHASSSIGRVAVSSLRASRWDRLWLSARRVSLEGPAVADAPWGPPTVGADSTRTARVLTLGGTSQQ